MDYKTIKVSVTAKHIKKGKRTKPCECPVALAMKDAGVNMPRVFFDMIEARSVGWCDARRIAPSKRMAEWVDRYDKKQIVEPTVFRLRVPVDVTERRPQNYYGMKSETNNKARPTDPHYWHGFPPWN